MDLWEALMPNAGKGLIHEANTTMAQVIKPGRKHLHRARRVCVATLHERLGGSGPKDPIELAYTPSALMRADIYTKHITSRGKLASCLRKIGVYRM